jgi:hypothetical protein
MKKLFLLTSVTFSLWACSGTEKTYDRLTDNQRSFLTNPPENYKIDLNDSNVIQTLVVGKYVITETLDKMYKGGQITPEERYYSEYGSVTYSSSNASDPFSISLTAHSSHAYNNTIATQSVAIAKPDHKYLYYNIDFSKTLPSKTIGGRQFLEVVFAISKQDTLFWKKDVGILGWTNTASGYTTRRVF